MLQRYTMEYISVDRQRLIGYVKSVQSDDGEWVKSRDASAAIEALEQRITELEHAVMDHRR